MGRPSAATADPVATTERILLAAERQFAADGFAAAKLADVAAAAGIRRPSLLYHFPSKVALYEAVIERVFSQLGDALLAAMELEGDFRQRFEAVVQSFSDFLASRPSFASLILRELLDDLGSGRAILEAQLVPLLDHVEHFLETHAENRLSTHVPLRALVLQIASGILLHAAAGSLREPLWRNGHDPVAVIRSTLFADPEEPT